MADIDATNLSPQEKREAVERGDTVLYPWRANERSLTFNVQDIMMGSVVPYEFDLLEDPDKTHDPVHTAVIRPI